MQDFSHQWTKYQLFVCELPYPLRNDSETLTCLPGCIILILINRLIHPGRLTAGSPGPENFPSFVRKKHLNFPGPSDFEVPALNLRGSQNIGFCWIPKICWILKDCPWMSSSGWMQAFHESLGSFLRDTQIHSAPVAIPNNDFIQGCKRDPLSGLFHLEQFNRNAYSVK